MLKICDIALKRRIPHRVSSKVEVVEEHTVCIWNYSSQIFMRISIILLAVACCESKLAIRVKPVISFWPNSWITVCLARSFFHMLLACSRSPTYLHSADCFCVHNNVSFWPAFCEHIFIFCLHIGSWSSCYKLHIKWACLKLTASCATWLAVFFGRDNNLQVK